MAQSPLKLLHVAGHMDSDFWNNPELVVKVTNPPNIPNNRKYPPITLFPGPWSPLCRHPVLEGNSRVMPYLPLCNMADK